MKFEMLDYRVEDGVAAITLNHPPANAIDATMAYELMHAAILADEDPTVRAALIAAEGKMFSGGGDLKAFAAAGEKLPHLLKEITTYMHAAVSRLARSRVPVITAVPPTPERASTPSSKSVRKVLRKVTHADASPPKAP